MQKELTVPVRRKRLQGLSFTRRMPIRWPFKHVAYLNGHSPNGAQPHVSMDSEVDNSQHGIHLNGSSPNGAQPHVSADSEVDSLHDPYPYGWRFIKTTTEDGQIETEIVALTIYDLLHPQLGDVVMHKPPHEDNYTYLKTTLTTQYKNQSGTFVSTDLRMDLDIPGVEPLVPDISVIFGVDKKQAWGTFDTKKEGTRPSVAFEITSPSTRDNDFGKKREYYAQAGIPFYIIVDIRYEDDNDADSQVVGYELYAYKLIEGKYVAIQPDDQGRCWIPPLGLSVGVGEEGVLCYDAQGELLLSHEQLDQALAEQEQRANAEAARAAEQERIAQEETERAAEQERRANTEAARAVEQERIAQEEAKYAAEQEQRANAEAARAAEQERVAQKEAARAVEQEQIAQKESERANEETIRAVKAEEENARLRALIAQLSGEAAGDSSD